MKEQKELIDAALEIAADIENNPYSRRDELDSKLIQAAKAYRQAREQPEAVEEGTQILRELSDKFAQRIFIDRNKAVKVSK